MALSPSEKIFVTKLKDAGYTAEQALDSLKKQRQKKAESFTGRLNLATQDISPQTAVKGEAISQATEDLNAPSFGERFMENLKQAPEAIFGAESLTGKTIGKVPILKNVPEAIKDTGEMAIEGTSQMLEGAGDVKDSFGADTFAEGVTEASGGVSKIIGGGISTAFSPIVGATTNLPIVGEPIEKGLGVLGEGIDAVAQATGNALATDEAGAEAIRGHINNLAMLLGTKYGPKATESLINTLKPYAKSLGEGVKADFPNATKSVTDTVGKFQEGFEQGRAKGFSSLTPEGGIASELGQIISSTAKIDPVKTVKFEQMTGKKPGEWLQERGVIAPRAETASALVDYWQTSKKAVDSTLAKIKGTFYDKSVERVLQDQIKYFTATADRANLSLTKKRLQTLQEGGLTLSEINSAKRLYESTEKLGYLKEQNSIKVERATNFDTAIREFLINTAEQKGFTNLRQLNKETQAAKFLADEIYRKMAKQDANNVLGLIDQMLAFGGVIDPSAWAALGLKKIVFGETGKSYIAKFLSPEKTKGIPSTPDELIELKNRRAELQESLKTSQSPSNKPSPSQANNPMTKTLPPKGNFNKAGTAESATMPKLTPEEQLAVSSEMAKINRDLPIRTKSERRADAKEWNDILEGKPTLPPKGNFNKAGTAELKNATKSGTIDGMDALIKEAKKYKSAEEFRAMTFNKALKLLRGVEQDSIVTIPTKNVKIIWKDDYMNAKETAKSSYDPSKAPPVEFIYDLKTGKYKLDDGHNRFVSAERNGQPIKGEITKIDGNMNELDSIYEKETGTSLTDLWKKANSK